jgi:hypothetical protein
MEKAVVVNNINRAKKVINRYKVIGIGSEFCHNILPKLLDELDVSTLNILKRKKILIYTPILTDPIFKNFVEKLVRFMQKLDNIEIMLNDIGLLNYLNYNFPNIKKGISRPLSIDLVRMNIKGLYKFVNDYNINSIETDEMDFIEKFKNKNFRIYLRIPLKYVGVSRFCPYERKITYSCSYQCLNKYEILKVRESDKEMILFENCYFIKKNVNFKKLNVDMIIKTYYE